MLRVVEKQGKTEKNTSTVFRKKKTDGETGYK